ncbi:hypothetical protein [Pseudomonas sp. 7-41]|uniref:hypothetical protein n=1 Tax=Pseudomonas sp. 7-41 TaxID=2898483 RepID=UPI001E2A64AD|nr:hypothetical protein [Pseudomonas sp. 7-41]UHG95290.1 hypothetical protein LQ249_16400 [Pseudomonas sp. 7-41]
MDFPKSVPNIGLVNGRFVDENTATGQPGSLIPSVWGNSVTLEILSVLSAGGIIPDETKTNQLALAISKIVAGGVTWGDIKEKPTTLEGAGITNGTPSNAVSSDYSNLNKTALYFLGNGSTANAPPGFSGSGAINHLLSDYAFTLAYSLATDAVSFRRKTPAGFGEWRTIWHSANFDPSSKANLAGPVFTGVPTAPTGAAGSNNTQIANCAFTWIAINTYATTVTLALSGKADKATNLSGYGLIPATVAEVAAGSDNDKPVTALGLTGQDPWALQPIGVPIPLFDNIAPSSTPPRNKAYRYITLTAGDSYNSGVLISEAVAGVAPLVVATAVINLAGSPVNGKTVSLINTEQRVLRGSATPGILLQDALQNITGGLSVASVGGATGSFTFTNEGSAAVFNGGNNRGAVQFDASRVARTDIETRAKSVGVTYYLRIK